MKFCRFPKLVWALYWCCNFNTLHLSLPMDKSHLLEKLILKKPRRWHKEREREIERGRERERESEKVTVRDRERDREISGEKETETFIYWLTQCLVKYLEILNFYEKMLEFIVITYWLLCLIFICFIHLTIYRIVSLSIYITLISSINPSLWA